MKTTIWSITTEHKVHKHINCNLSIFRQRWHSLKLWQYILNCQYPPHKIWHVYVNVRFDQTFTSKITVTCVLYWCTMFEKTDPMVTWQWASMAAVVIVAIIPFVSSIKYQPTNSFVDAVMSSSLTTEVTRINTSC